MGKKKQKKEKKNDSFMEKIYIFSKKKDFDAPLYLDDKVEKTLSGAVVMKGSELADPINPVIINPHTVINCIQADFKQIFDNLIHINKYGNTNTYTLVCMCDKSKPANVFNENRYILPLEASSTLPDVLKKLEAIWNNLNTSIIAVADENTTVENSDKSASVFYAPNLYLYDYIYSGMHKSYLKSPVYLNLLVIGIDPETNTNHEGIYNNIYSVYNIMKKLDVTNPIVDIFSFPVEKEQRGDVITAWMDAGAQMDAEGKLFNSVVLTADSEKKYDLLMNFVK